MATNTHCPLTPKPPANEIGHYLAMLRATDQSTKGVPLEEHSLRIGEWRFCYLQLAPGVRRSSAAVHPTHGPVRANCDSNWWLLLTEPGMDARRAHRSVTWLMERPAPIEPGCPVLRNPKVAGMVSAPSLFVQGAQAMFRGWVVWPPEMEDPSLVTVDARQGMPTSPTITCWDQVEAI